MRITKRHQNRPCDVILPSGKRAHGVVNSVKNGIVKIVDLYISDIRARENGQFTACLELKKHAKNITIY